MSNPLNKLSKIISSLDKSSSSDSADNCPVILYACIHNSGRSVAAKVLTKYYARDKVTVLSAGSEPASSINPDVAAILNSLGLSTAEEIPTLLDSKMVKAADIVITMGCGETCPVFPGKTYLNWEVSDPVNQPFETVIKIVKDIDARVRNLLDELGINIGSSVFQNFNSEY
jgi:arsenate reductase